MEQLLTAATTLIENSKYVLMFLGGYFEGPTVTLTTGLLWRLGSVEFLPAYMTLYIADILGDVMWYVIGLYGAAYVADHWGHWFGVNKRTLATAESFFNERHTKILVFSKLTMGLGLAVAVLLTAGMLRVPFVRYLAINMSAGLVWTLFLMLVGYNFGNIATYIPSTLQIGFLILLPIAFYFGVRMVGRRLESIHH